jgi:hypothetical protein
MDAMCPDKRQSCTEEICCETPPQPPTTVPPTTPYVPPVPPNVPRPSPSGPSAPTTPAPYQPRDRDVPIQPYPGEYMPAFTDPYLITPSSSTTARKRYEKLPEFVSPLDDGKEIAGDSLEPATTETENIIHPKIKKKTKDPIRRFVETLWLSLIIGLTAITIYYGYQTFLILSS